MLISVAQSKYSDNANNFDYLLLLINIFQSVGFIIFVIHFIWNLKYAYLMLYDVAT